LRKIQLEIEREEKIGSKKRRGNKREREGSNFD
jgi:hypothetical protein